MRKKRSRIKQNRDHGSGVGGSFLEECREKNKTKTDAICEIEGRFGTLVENDTSINTLEALFPLDELFDAAGFGLEGNGVPGALIDNPSVAQVLERPVNGHEAAQNHSTMHPLQLPTGFNDDKYIETSALREDILVAYRNNNDLRLAVQQQDTE